MKKVKRYNEEGYVTSDDSNAGMKEARDAIDADIAKTPSADYGDYTPTSSSQTIAAPKAKAPIVTKEQLAKSGLTLREYMNKQQGLKSSGEKTATTKSVAKNEDEGKRPVSSSARNILEEAKESVRRGNAARSSMAEASRPKMEVGRLPKKGPGLSNFKSGGSASSRADGIATKGKTRGKMC